ncbi:hypothetical protein TrCOL_g9791 [Triparma columacea]|uniref:Uncharacterized protein n=1 Tax=Triparma columacea TaxID=722753 RepID=A0A9W7LB89_9STRA|nr:hypothetical protein TrCOL_g9791 [Triparma columacea]
MAEKPSTAKKSTTKLVEEEDEVVVVKTLKNRVWKAFTPGMQLAYAKLSLKHEIFSKSKHDGKKYFAMKKELLVDINSLHVQWSLKEVIDVDTNFNFLLKLFRRLIEAWVTTTHGEGNSANEEDPTPMEVILEHLHDDQQKEEANASLKGAKPSTQTSKNNAAEAIMKNNGNKKGKIKHLNYNPDFGSKHPISPFGSSSKASPPTMDNDENSPPNDGGGGSSVKKRKNLFDAEVEQRDKTTDRMFTLLESMSGDGPAPPKNSKEELEKKMEGYLAQAELRTGPFKDYYLEQAEACLEKLKKDFGG